MNRVYIAIHYALGIALFFSAPSEIVLKGILIMMYALLVPLFFYFSRRGDKDMIFLGFFTLATYPFFAVILYFMSEGTSESSMMALTTACVLAAVAIITYERGIKMRVLEAELEAEPETKEQIEPVSVEREPDIDACISSIKESIKTERMKNEKLKERIKEIKEKIDSLQQGL
jgi:hypothetical protein